MFGLIDTDLNNIRAVISKHSDVETAFIFGSRAKGNYRNGSDVDIALKGTSLNYKTIVEISSELNEETLMPYHFDILNYHTINNDDLINHINRVGVSFYEANSTKDLS